MQAFMVGDRVDVHSRSAKGGDATIWSSDGSGQFTVKTVPAEVSISSFCYVYIYIYIYRLYYTVFLHYTMYYECHNMCCTQC
jgi:hypothetical protein